MTPPSSPPDKRLPLKELTGRTWVFERLPLTANRLLRAHWTAQRREVKAWSAWVLKECGWGPLLQTRVRLEIVVYRSRLQDPDNRVASVKPLIDALKRRGWIRDDSEEFLELTVLEWKCRRKEERTEVHWRSTVE